MLSKETTLPSENSPATKESLLKRLEILMLNSRMAENKFSGNDDSHTNRNDISYFDGLMAEIVAMNYVRSDDPTSFTSAHLLLLEEANLVWARLCASGIVNSTQPALENFELADFSTSKRARTPSSEAGCASKWGMVSPSQQQHQKHSNPSSRKFLQLASGRKSAVESPNWREDAKDNAMKSTTTTPTKVETISKFKLNCPEDHTFMKNTRMVSTDITKNPIMGIPNITDAIQDHSPHIFKLEKKVDIPEHPGYNFIGRILGPRGISIRQLEAATQCGILIRGKGSVKDREKEKRLSGKPGYEHLQEQLHVHITAMGTNMAQCQEHMNEAVSVIESLLTPTYDEYKKTQLIHLAIINGTYRAPVKNSEPAKENVKDGMAKNLRKHA